MKSLKNNVTEYSIFLISISINVLFFYSSFYSILFLNNILKEAIEWFKRTLVFYNKHEEEMNIVLCQHLKSSDNMYDQYDFFVLFLLQLFFLRRFLYRYFFF